MSYINYEILTAKGLSLQKLGVLTLIKQNRIEDLSQQIEFEVKDTIIVEKLSEMGYIEQIKGKAKDTFYQKLRTTKSGNEVLDLISTPLITDADIQMYNYLCEMYLNEDATRTLGNRKAGLRYCAEFRQIMGFTPHEMYYLCQMFVSNTTFTKVLEYIFFEKKHFPYGKFKDNLDASKIFQFWQDNEYEIREYWVQKIKTD